MINEWFITESSWVHQTDPRVRILFSVIFSFVVTLDTKFISLFAAVGISVMAVMMAGIDLRVLAKRVLAFNGLVLLFWVLLPLTFPGEPLYQWGPVAISKAGIRLASQITLKSNAIMLVFIAFIATSPVSTMAHALQRLHVPSKIIHILLLTYRYVFVIEQEYQRLMRAMKTRGFVPGTNLHTYRTYAYLIGMVFLRSVDRAHRVHQAMICRGFDGTFYSLARFGLKSLDYGVVLLMVLLMAGIAVLEWTSKI